MTYSPRDCLLAFESLGGKVSAMSTAFTFKDSGYCGSRFERTYFLADCGPLCADALPAHGHADMLSFEWDIDGQRCIVDAGVYEYEPGHWRALNRSAESHNTVVIGNQDQCELIGSFRIGRRSHANTVLDKWEKGTRLIGGQHSAYRQGIAAVKHRREFQVRESDLVVSDELSVQGKADGNPEEAVARLLLSHEVRVLEANEHRIDLSLSGTRFAVTSSAKMRLRPFHWSPNFGQMYETFQIELIYGPIPCSGKFHLRILE